MCFRILIEVKYRIRGEGTQKRDKKKVAFWGEGNFYPFFLGTFQKN